MVRRSQNVCKAYAKMRYERYAGDWCSFRSDAGSPQKDGEAGDTYSAPNLARRTPRHLRSTLHSAVARLTTLPHSSLSTMASTGVNVRTSTPRLLLR